MRMKNKELLGKHLDVLRFVYDIYYIFFLYRTLVQFKAMGFFFFFFFWSSHKTLFSRKSCFTVVDNNIVSPPVGV